MRYLDIENWNRKQHFDHFRKLRDPYFAVVVEVDVTETYSYAKRTDTPFFALYLYACLKAINSVENFRYRIQGEKVVIHDAIHASATISREDNTFGCTFIYYDENFETFLTNFRKEKQRILTTTDLFPANDSDDCIHCSALPWLNFSGHKEPFSGIKDDSVPKLAFGKFSKKENRLMMPVSVAVNHALVDGYHLGEFFKQYQIELNKIN